MFLDAATTPAAPLPRPRGWRAFALMGTLLIALLSMLSCGNGADDAVDGKTTLRLMVWSGGGEETFGLEKQIIEEFKRLNPDIHIKLVFCPYNSYSEKILTLAVGKDLPDVFWIPQQSFAYLANRGVLMDITDRAKKDIDLSKYFPAAVDLVTYAGRMYGLPRDVCCYFLVYNRDMFREAGLPDPKPDWTWADLREMGKKLTRKDASGKTTQYAYVWYPIDLIYQNGGKVLDATFRKAYLDQPECYEGLQWFADDINKYGIAPNGQTREALGDGMFMQGKAAMYATGPWMIGVYAKECKFSWDIINMPAGKAGPTARLLGLPIAISKTTKHPEEAWRLLKFLCYSDEAQSMQGRIGVAMPARADLANGPDFKGQKMMPPGIDNFLHTMSHEAVAEYTSPAYGSIQRALDTMVDEANLGRITAKEAAENAQKDVDTHIRKAIIRGLIK